MNPKNIAPGKPKSFSHLVQNNPSNAVGNGPFAHLLSGRHSEQRIAVEVASEILAAGAKRRAEK